MSDENKRNAERIEILGELHGEIMIFEQLTIKEISRTGAKVETSFPLTLDSLHDLRLTLADRAIVLKARVAHCRIADVDQEVVMYRSGLEFIEPSGRVFQAVAEFIDQIRDSRGPRGRAT